MKPILGLTAVFFLSTLLVPVPVGAEDKDAKADTEKPSASQTISANGFTCTQVGTGTTCQGKFKDLDKKTVFSASGQGQVIVQAQKKKKKYTYASDTGCLCETGKSNIRCTNQSGKKKNFKRDKRIQESSAFCKGK